MANKTGIEWTDTTWNPVTGCTKVSQGCKNCYAERVWNRLSAPGQPYENRKFTDIRVHGDRLDAPLGWRQPRRVFVNSMSDLFHEQIDEDFIAQIFWIMGLASKHTFQVLTKRPERMMALMNSDDFADHATDMARECADLIWSPPNVWLGVSVEDQKTADARIPILLQTPAAIRFLSCEPLLGPIDIGFPFVSDNPWMTQQSIDWVIVGGETGPYARRMQADWAWSIRDQCIESMTPFFFKQWGEFSEVGYLCGKKKAGRELDGQIWEQYPDA